MTFKIYLPDGKPKRFVGPYNREIIINEILDNWAYGRWREREGDTWHPSKWDIATGENFFVQQCCVRAEWRKLWINIYDNGDHNMHLSENNARKYFSGGGECAVHFREVLADNMP